MSDESIQSSLTMTPQQLAVKLNSVVDEVTALAESGGPEWAQEARSKHVKKHEADSEHYSNEGVVLTTEKARELCPELFEHLIDPGIRDANKTGEIYRTPSDPEYIVLDKHNYSFTLNAAERTIGVSINNLARQRNMLDACTCVTHEWWHAFQHSGDGQPHPEDYYIGPLSKGKSFAPAFGIREKVASEFDADRATSYPMNTIAFFLTGICDSEYGGYYDATDKPDTCPAERYSHPNDRARIKSMLEKALSNEIFGVNGKWQEREGKHFFVPNNISQSNKEIKKRFRDRTRGKINIGADSSYPITESGEMVVNWQELQVATEQKAEELMKKLDKIVNPDDKEVSQIFQQQLKAAKTPEDISRVTREHLERLRKPISQETAQQWLDMAQEEITRFRETHKPEFSVLAERRFTLKDRVINRGIGSQRGGSFSI